MTSLDRGPIDVRLALLLFSYSQPGVIRTAVGGLPGVLCFADLSGILLHCRYIAGLDLKVSMLCLLCRHDGSVLSRALSAS